VSWTRGTPSGAPSVGFPLIGALLLLSSCSDRVLIPPEKFVHHEPDERYEDLFPHYVEICAVTQYRSEELGMGGSPGHAVMYLKGACRDKQAPYPKLRRCLGDGTDPKDPEHGAGISVNRWFRSANWVAFAGRGQFYGDLAPDEVVTLDRLREAAREAVEDGVYQGVELWPWPGETPDSDLVDFATLRSAGTDFALRYARSALCGRVPVEAEMLDEIIDFLNDLNREFVTGAADYEWSGYADNCVHTLRNALAAASIREPISVRATKLRQLFNLAIPANEAIGLAVLGTMGPLDSYAEIFREDALRNAMLEFGWLPTRHGALLVSLPVHPANELFDTRPRLLAFQGPFLAHKTRRLIELLDDPRFTALDPNLRYFAARYRKILSSREAPETLAAVRGDRHRRFRRRYFSMIEQELAEVRSMQGDASPARVLEGSR
jgi:hypothetical protein